MQLSIVESKIDDIIESSKRNLFTEVKNNLGEENPALTEKAIEIIEKDLEEKRVNLKIYFKEQIEKINEESFRQVVKDYTL